MLMLEESVPIQFKDQFRLVHIIKPNNNHVFKQRTHIGIGILFQTIKRASGIGSCGFDGITITINADCIDVFGRGRRKLKFGQSFGSGIMLNHQILAQITRYIFGSDDILCTHLFQQFAIHLNQFCSGILGKIHDIHPMNYR